MKADRLELDREEMRRLGYRAVDMLVDEWTGLNQRPVGRKAGREELMAALDEPPPREGAPPEVVLERLARDVFPNVLRIHHPRFFAFVPGPSNFAAAVGDFLAAGHNVFAGNWLSGSAASAMELVVTGWLRDLCGLAPGAEGLFVSGGSVANLTGLLVARHAMLGNRLDGAVAYLSEQTHSSVERALRIIGLLPDQIRKLGVNDQFQLSVHDLRAAVAADRAAGRRPFCVAGNAGAVNTGAVDPLNDLADFCEAEDLWLHVDGAFGAAAAICERGRRELRGLERVHSLSLDPHKWLFQPYEAGCVFVRQGSLLRETFRITAEYLRDVHRPSEEVHFCDRGVQLTRSFRSLKVWLTFQIFGVDAIQRAVERGFELAEYAEQRLRSMPEFELVTPAKMAVVTFRLKGLPERAYEQAVARMLEDGYAFLTSTVIRGKAALRLCTINPRTQEEDIDSTLDRLNQICAELAR